MNGVRKPAPVVLSRVLTVVGEPKERVRVSIHKPVKVAAAEWQCRYSIKGMGDNVSQRVPGADPVQSFLLAVEGIHIKLKNTGKQFTWGGGVPGTGFPRMIPLYFGEDFARQLEELVDREVERFAREAKARRANRSKPQ